MNPALKVLIVDDEVSQRAGLAAMVSAWGMIAETAGDGNEALARLTNFAADVIITDLNMPVMNGLELIKALRAVPSLLGLPIVFLTTESSDAVKAEAKKAGATGWITKPFKQDQLLAVVGKLVRS